MTKSHFCASAAVPTVISRASPSYRSITIPFASGKCLSGSASTTSPTVHFQPLAAVLYTGDLLTSSLNSLAHSSEKAFTAMFSPSSAIRIAACAGSLGTPYDSAHEPQPRRHPARIGQAGPRPRRDHPRLVQVHLRPDRRAVQPGRLEP